MNWTPDDGGRAAAGYKGHTGDCVARAVAIATQQPYQVVYDALAAGNAGERRTRQRTTSGQRTARRGIKVERLWFQRYMQGLGWRFTPTMGIGTGCTVHLRATELPKGRLIVSLSGHYAAVIEGVLHDDFRTQYEAEQMCRGGTRCVYGYWSKQQEG